jgi:uncharacterized protein (DUF488 family)
MQSTIGRTEPDFFMIGYEKIDPEELFDMLKTAGVHCLVDVRNLPRSRRAFYNKNVLQRKLNDLSKARGYKIEYISITALGNPPENRKGHCGSPEATEAYRGHVLNQLAALDQLNDIISRCRTALMCYEADPACCHRSALAEIMAERYGLTGRDLRVPGTQPVLR